MKAKEFSVKQMLATFVLVNSLIIILVFAYPHLNSTIQHTEVKGTNFPTPQFNYEDKAHFSSTFYPFEFDYPGELGKATSIIKESTCAKREHIENITFTQFPDLRIIINACDEGLNMFIPETELNFANQTGRLKFTGVIRANLRSPDTFDLKLITEKKQTPNIMITANFNEQEITAEELSVLLGSLIYSMNFD